MVSFVSLGAADALFGPCAFIEHCSNLTMRALRMSGDTVFSLHFSERQYTYRCTKPHTVLYNEHELGGK